MPPYPIQNLITVSGFKARNPEIDTSSWADTTVSGFISTATRAIQNFCQVDAFLTTTVSGEQSKTIITPMGDLLVWTRVRPIVSVTAIRLVKGGFSTTLTLSGSNGQLYYQKPYPYNSINYPSSYLAGTGTLMIGGSTQLVTLRSANTYTEIDYKGGFTTVPEDLQDACDLWVRDIMMRRLNPMGAMEVRQGSVSFSRALRSSGNNQNSFDTVWVQEARQILSDGGYVRSAMG